MDPPPDLDVDGLGIVDHDLSHVGILEQRLDRPVSEDVVEHVQHDLALIGSREGRRLLIEQLAEALLGATSQREHVLPGEVRSELLHQQQVEFSLDRVSRVASERHGRLCLRR